MRTVDDILNELFEIDPDLRQKEADLRRVISELYLHKPDTKFDEAFVRRLRAELLEKPLSGKPIVSPFWTLNRSMLLGTVLVAAMLVIVILPKSGKPVFEQQFTSKAAGAFGKLSAGSGQSDFKAMSFAADNTQTLSAPSAAPVSEPGADKNLAAENQTSAAAGSSETGPVKSGRMGVAVSPAPTAVAGQGLGAGPMIAYVGPGTVTSYVYKGNLNLQSEGLVYERLRDANAGSNMAGALRKLNLGLINLGDLKNYKLNNISLTENRSDGYSIYINFDEGSISLNQNHPIAPMDAQARAGNEQGPLPDDSRIIDLAESFLAAHGIDRQSYGAAYMRDDFRKVMSASSAPGRESMPAYQPEFVDVTFPLLIKGVPVYDQSGEPFGIIVGVNIKSMEVVSLNNLYSQNYDYSSYKLVTDKNQIADYLAKGASAYPSDAADKREVELNAPEQVLMHYYTYNNGQSKELFIPALRFANSDTNGPKNVIVPLAPDLLNQPGPAKVNIY